MHQMMSPARINFFSDINLIISLRCLSFYSQMPDEQPKTTQGQTHSKDQETPGPRST
jgi:hypothetical protein